MRYIQTLSAEPDRVKTARITLLKRTAVRHAVRRAILDAGFRRGL